MKPVIAIPRLGPGLVRLYLGLQFHMAITAAGGRLRWIGPKEIASCTACDGLLIPGGDDVDPALYGQTKTELCGNQNPLRDRLDPALLNAFLPTGKPILGVCRGMQMLNVHLGGTLHQDIKALQTLCHQQLKARHKGVHAVSVTEGTLLHRIVGCSTLQVNTIHHQAADRLADGLTVCARSDDGFAEAAVLEGHPFCLAVQWHPEFMYGTDPLQKKLIDAFITACRS